MSRTDVKEIIRQLRRNPGTTEECGYWSPAREVSARPTLSAALCLLGAAEGRRVLAVDQDAQQNLAYSLGYPPRSVGCCDR